MEGLLLLATGNFHSTFATFAKVRAARESSIFPPVFSELSIESIETRTKVRTDGSTSRGSNIVEGGWPSTP